MKKTCLFLNRHPWANSFFILSSLGIAQQSTEDLFLIQLRCPIFVGHDRAFSVILGDCVAINRGSLFDSAEIIGSLDAPDNDILCFSLLLPNISNFLF
jgi:hypothetical protein